MTEADGDSPSKADLPRPLTKHPGGRSYRGNALEGADFSGADLRGADFSGAMLRGARMRGAQLGVRPSIGTGLMVLALVISVGAGLGIGWAVSGVRGRVSSGSWDEVAEGGSVGLILVLFVLLLLWKGFDIAIRVVGIAYTVVLVGNIVLNAIFEEVEFVRAARATVLFAFLVFAVLAGIFGRVVGGVFGSWSVAVVALAGGLASGRWNGGVAGIVVALCLVIISKRVLRGDPRDISIRRVAHRLVRRWGTRFVDADLTGVDFTGADTSRCDVRGATLDDVTWDPECTMPVDAPS